MEILYELWLHTMCDFEPETVEKAVVLFENKGRRFSSGMADRFKLSGTGLSPKFADRIGEAEYFKQAQDILDYCRNNDIRIIEWDSEEYPQSLRYINSPPRILFAKGKRIDLNNNLCVSVVGSRKPTPQGKAVAREISNSLAYDGIVVVSGMAEGIDAEAHRGAIDAGGKTVAVLAGSVDTIYPKCNEKLYYEILKCGTVISERPPGTVVKPYFYQQRNRIVVGLSQGTIVVEGEIKSGTAITARLAVENGRDVFAVPGNPMVKMAELPNNLISEGAMIVDRIQRPLEYYKETKTEYFENNLAPKQEEVKRFEGFSDEDRAILEFIAECGGVADAEKITEALGIAANVMNTRLTVLCIRGVLRQESGNRFIVVKY